MNRIDELDNPGEQVPEIRASILDTLHRLTTVREPCILFGSARWAEAALTGRHDILSKDSLKSVRNWASTSGIEPELNPNTFIWRLSGIPSLMRAIYERVVSGPGERHLAAVEASLRNLSHEVQVQEAIAANAKVAAHLAALDMVALRKDLDALRNQAVRALDDVLATGSAALGGALDAAMDAHIEEALRHVAELVRNKGTESSLSFGAADLRRALRLAYDHVTEGMTANVTQIYQATAGAFAGLCSISLGLDVDELAVEPPKVPDIPPPVVLGKTIVIDLGTSWWKRWWQRQRTADSVAADYAALVEAEIASIITELKETHASEAYAEMRETLLSFIDDQVDSILGYVRNAILQVSGKPAEAGLQPSSIVPFASRGERGAATSVHSAQAISGGLMKPQLSAGGSK